MTMSGGVHEPPSGTAPSPRLPIPSPLPAPSPTPPPSTVASPPWSPASNALRSLLPHATRHASQARLRYRRGFTASPLPRLKHLYPPASSRDARMHRRDGGGHTGSPHSRPAFLLAS